MDLSFISFLYYQPVEQSSTFTSQVPTLPSLLEKHSSHTSITMITPLSTLLLASLAYASPLLEVRTVTALDQASFAEAQKRDATATRAFSNTEIKVGYLSLKRRKHSN